MTFVLPKGSSSWSDKAKDDYKEGYEVWGNYEGRGLDAFADMHNLLFLKQLIGKMVAQEPTLIKKKKYFEAGRVAGNIARHNVHLAHLEANPQLQT